MPPAEVQLFFGTVVFVVLCSVLVTQYFAAPETRWHVRFSVVVSLVTSASIVALVPFDVYTVRRRLLIRSPRTLPAARTRALRDPGERTLGRPCSTCMPRLYQFSGPSRTGTFHIVCCPSTPLISSQFSAFDATPMLRVLSFALAGPRRP
jgi:hypothetical protein